MQTRPSHSHTTFQSLSYQLDGLLDDPAALAEHLGALAQCPSCRTLIESFDQALDRLHHDAPLVADELFSRQASYHDLIQLAPAARRLEIDSEDPGLLLRSWGLVDLLLTNARQAETLDEARELAKLGLFLAHRLEDDIYLPVYLADLLARAHATLAQVELRAARLDLARIQRDLARAHAKLGTGAAHSAVDAAEAEIFEAEGRIAEADALRLPAEGEGETAPSLCDRLIARLTRYSAYAASGA